LQKREDSAASWLELGVLNRKKRSNWEKKGIVKIYRTDVQIVQRRTARIGGGGGKNRTSRRECTNNIKNQLLSTHNFDNGYQRGNKRIMRYDDCKGFDQGGELKGILEIFRTESSGVARGRGGVRKRTPTGFYEQRGSAREGQ